MAKELDNTAAQEIFDAVTQVKEQLTREAEEKAAVARAAEQLAAEEAATQRAASAGAGYLPSVALATPLIV